MGKFIISTEVPEADALVGLWLEKGLVFSEVKNQVMKPDWIWRDAIDALSSGYFDRFMEVCQASSGLRPTVSVTASIGARLDEDLRRPSQRVMFRYDRGRLELANEDSRDAHLSNPARITSLPELAEAIDGAGQRGFLWISLIFGIAITREENGGSSTFTSADIWNSACLPFVGWFGSSAPTTVPEPVVHAVASAGSLKPIPRLVTVKNLSDLGDNVRRFATTTEINGHLAIKFARHTRYWVYDVDEDVFCPNTFAGYRDMTFDLYSRFTPQIYKQIGYDGKIAPEAIEAILPNFRPDDELFLRLREWLNSVVGSGALSESSTMVREFTTVGRRVYRAIACDPDRYDALSACQSLKEITWTADPDSIDAGDRVIIWQTLNAKKRRGVVGIGECVAAPETLPEPEAEWPFWKQKRPGPANRCRIRLLDAPGLPLWIDDHPELLANLPVARAHGGTFFSLERAKWQAIRGLAGASLSAAGAIIEVAGQGRQLHPRVRKVVEMRAMELAENHFLGEGWLVDPDVHKTRPYDLVCTKEGQTLYVEAKGTVGAGQSVVLTRNEVAHVRANPGSCVLFVVGGIKIEWSDGKPQASGGTARIILPWQIQEDDLSATQYDYAVPG